MKRVLLHLIAFLACMLCSAGCVQAAGVLIVISDRGAVYGEVRDALLAELERSGVARAADVNVLVASEVGSIDFAGGDRPRLVMTLGADALKQVLVRELRLPIIAALIPRAGYERILSDAGKKSVAPVSALYLDQPFVRQLELLRLALPGVKRVGVLWGPESISQQRSLTSAMQVQGFDPVYGIVGSDGVLFSGLKAALDGAEILLAVADPHVFNSATISNILLATYRARIPVVAFSPAYVKAGALLSLHTTPQQIGLQAASMSRMALQGAALPASQYPQDFVVSVNEYVARSLGMVMDGQNLTDRLRRTEKRP